MKIIHREKITPIHLTAKDSVRYTFSRDYVGWFGGISKEVVFEHTIVADKPCTITEVVLFEDEFEGRHAQGIFHLEEK